jgi:parallel beta-helix repeat protein
MYKHLVFALLASLVLISRANADVTFISSCNFPIMQPGQYHLAQDLTCSGNGIDVQANDVELHFDGHTLTGPGTPGSGSVGVFSSGVTNLSIHGDGTITGFLIGIDLKDNSGALIVNMTTTNNSGEGIDISGGSGNTLISNTANGNPIGISLAANTTNNTVRANKTDGNGVGIEVVSFGTGNLLQANQAHNNSLHDLFDINPGPPCANTWKSNHFETSGGAGVSCIH